MFEKIFSPDTYTLVGQWALGFFKNLLVAIIVYIVGRWLIKWVGRLFTKMLERSKVEATLYTFLLSIVNVVLWFTLIIVIVGILGIETSSFIALFASAGVAIGMALSGTLQNFAGGVMILLFKPFKVGDFIEAQGYSGTVKEIQIFNTIVRTNDAQTIIIPNGGLATGSMKNYSTEKYRRVDLEFQFAYGTDLDKVKQAIMDIIVRNKSILAGPVADSPVVAAPWIGLTKLGDSGVSVTTRTWCLGTDYWAVAGYLNETVYQELKAQGFMFPFNRMDVTILNK
ncbi:MAG: mechanosensitive ion channel [Prevotella sp.]|nr:mechanosensitive ion channel [Prevotella sp.]